MISVLGIVVFGMIQVSIIVLGSWGLVVIVDGCGNTSCGGCSIKPL